MKSEASDADEELLIEITARPQKLPFMPVPTDEFIGRTYDMTAPEVGAYWRICMAMWAADGKLPDDDVRLARTAGVSNRAWLTMRATVLRNVTRAGGKISEPWIIANLIKTKERSRKNADSAKRGHEKRRQNRFSE